MPGQEWAQIWRRSCPHGCFNDQVLGEESSISGREVARVSISETFQAEELAETL